MARSLGTLALLLAVTVSGAAGLTWEVLYQHHSALALGISDQLVELPGVELVAALRAGRNLATVYASPGACASRPPASSTRSSSSRHR